MYFVMSEMKLVGYGNRNELITPWEGKNITRNRNANKERAVIQEVIALSNTALLVKTDTNSKRDTIDIIKLQN